MIIHQNPNPTLTSNEDTSYEALVKKYENEHPGTLLSLYGAACEKRAIYKAMAIKRKLSWAAFYHEHNKAQYLGNHLRHLLDPSHFVRTAINAKRIRARCYDCYKYGQSRRLDWYNHHQGFDRHNRDCAPVTSMINEQSTVPDILARINQLMPLCVRCANWRRRGREYDPQNDGQYSFEVREKYRAKRAARAAIP